MKRMFLLLSCMISAPATAWDPVSVFQNAVQGQINHQIRRNVSEAFRSIATPTTGTRPADAEIRDARPGEVVLYATPNCGYCKQARAHMQSRNIAYLEKDILSNAQAESEWRALGGRGVPLTIMGSHKLMGFSAASFDKTYAKFQAEQTSAAPAASGPTQPNAKTASTAHSPSVIAYTEGDLLTTRIARVKLLADPQAESAALTQLDKKEEVIYLGETQGRYLRVKSASAEGWVDRALVVKP